MNFHILFWLYEVRFEHTENLHRMHLVACLLIANLADIIAGVLRSYTVDLQIVVADNLESLIACDFQMARCQNRRTTTPQKYEGACARYTLLTIAL